MVQRSHSFIKKRRTRILIAAGYGLIILIFIILYSAGARFREATSWASNSHEVLFLLNKLHVMIEAAETSQRGYILTGDKIFLTPYLEMEKKAEEYANRLAYLVQDNPVQMRNVYVLKNFLFKKIKSLESVVDITDNKSRDTAIKLIQSGEGLNIMTELRQAFNAFEAEENALLNQRVRLADQTFNKMAWLIAICLLLAFTFLTVVILILRREVVSRSVVQFELEEARVKALEVSELKSKFLANMSHEIRTPPKWYSGNGRIGFAEV